MATSCFIDDFVKRQRSSILFTETNFSSVIDSWFSPDKMLVDLQSIDLFKGRLAWNDLDPIHFRILITNTFNNRDKVVDPSKFYSDSDPVVATLYFLLMGLVYCMQRRTCAAVDGIRVTRVTELDVSFQFDITMMSEEKKKKPVPQSKHGLQVIVDNTDK